MRSLLILLGIILSFPLQAQSQLKHQLERLNFFPEADAYTQFRYEYERLDIETPIETVMTKEVKNYTNSVVATYAHRFGRKYFIGVNGYFEQASENAVTYGIPLRRRFTSKGVREPELFTIYRLRHQREARGLIDLYFSYSPSIGKREIGGDDVSRFNGRDIMRLYLSHGLWEGEWEFKTALGLNYFGKGEEKNTFADRNFELENYYVLNFQFYGQYTVNSWLFTYASVGLNYTSLEIIREAKEPKREIQAGTGSIFELGFKKPLNRWSLIELGFQFNRYEYFVKGDTDNLDGEARRQRVWLSYRHAF